VHADDFYTSIGMLFGEYIVAECWFGPVLASLYKVRLSIRMLCYVWKYMRTCIAAECWFGHVFIVAQMLMIFMKILCLERYQRCSGGILSPIAVFGLFLQSSS
jgi:hypothetical protein